ncbi:ATP synthase F0 subcomplex A subunit [Saccharopolyspora erythraea NRRL 2338]|uniref:ATP synthase subunit a n=2 Tax=Saccharopolyspora erythraea TaxID=1836 RepID=A4FKF9_SACEN|nr:F0F1 ATP synthase subunit A [Saccharopolyspora erythraea]EQD81343.1 ATP synthase subunit A [Saccharopolyspora erythraea D]PFG98171.1 ATP synthase F0 subcomplex A subunit [Saccharopolyspora erythraea NRRL 2338]QRK88272.1 F0F1 ATP synthase subunit A [Saccharopolyspora erythraea]CAM04534.1 ATP synthase A chain [Saccharopolyspora erythraea NRRL 2338]
MGTRMSAAGGEFQPPGAESLDLPPILLGVTKPMLLCVLSVAVVAAFFLVSTKRLKLVPGRFQFAVESVYDLARNGIAREQIGAKDFRRFVPLVLALFTFVLVNNIFGIIPLIQFPTMARIGFPAALAVLVVYPVYHYVGFRRHGFTGYLKKALFPPGVPKPVYVLVTPIEFVLKFFFDPVSLALRVFGAMLAGHLMLLVFTLGGEYLLLEAGAMLKPVSVLAFAMAIAMTLLEAFIQVLQAYIFALLSASYIGRALAEDH